MFISRVPEDIHPQAAATRIIATIWNIAKAMATVTAGLAAVQEKSESPVAVLGYSGTVAFGHILVTTCGTLIILLLS